MTDSLVLLINPPCVLPATEKLDGDKFVAEHIGLGYLAAYVRQQSPKTCVEIIDAYLHGITAKTIAALIVSKQPTAVGFSVAYHPALEGLKWVFDELRSLNWKGFTIVGGNHASLAPEAVYRVAPEVSAVVHGDGEETLLELINSVAYQKPLLDVSGISIFRGGKIFKTSPRALIHNLDLLPFPARDTLPHVLQRGGTAYVSASRGCYARCKFCTITEFYSTIGPRWRARSAKSIVNEMRALVDTYGVERVFFVDDNFIGPGNAGKRRILDFANELEKSGLKLAFSIQTRSDDIDEDLAYRLRRVGLRLVFLGLESGSQEVLDFYRKDNTVSSNLKSVQLLNQHKVAGIYGLIMFNPNSTWKQFYETIEFIRLVGDYNLQWIGSMLRDLPGAPFELQLKDIEKIPSKDGFTFFQVNDPGVRHLVCMLRWLMSPVIRLCAAWEEKKWRLNMKYNVNMSELEHFHNLTLRLHSRILQSIVAAAKIVDTAWHNERRLANQYDLICQRVELLSISDEYLPEFEDAKNDVFPLATF